MHHQTDTDPHPFLEASDPTRQAVSLTLELEALREAVGAAHLLCERTPTAMREDPGRAAAHARGAAAVLRLVRARLRLIHLAIADRPLVHVLRDPTNAVSATREGWEDGDVRIG
jgi:hypothetical protein